MKVHIYPDAGTMGAAAAAAIAASLKDAINARGQANLLLSTGASQFTTLAQLVKEKIDWPKVLMFHLDEYIGLPATHRASFRKYLRERLIDLVPMGKAYLIDGQSDVAANIRGVSEAIAAHPIDVGVIGIGENAHIAFNDPPADFEKADAYHIVKLNDACKRQQVGEGWFATMDEVPGEAISITPRQILRCRHIIAPVPGLRKANAIRDMLNAKRVDPTVPASLLKTHPDCDLYVDLEAYSRCEEELIWPNL